MAVSDIPVLAMLRTRMQWHQERQRLLAENVSNADTPNFRPRDLAQPKFDRDLETSVKQVSLALTDPGHIGGSLGGDTSAGNREQFQIRPAGNAVSLEDEMMKVAGNQMDYQTATALYGRSLGLIKTALGK